MREHKLTALTQPDYEIHFLCSCGVRFWSCADGTNTRRDYTGTLVSQCPAEANEWLLRRTFFPNFFTEGPLRVFADIDAKKRFLCLFGIAISDQV